MAKTKKATKAELASINDVNDKINQEIFNLGLLEDNKIQHIRNIQDLKSKFQKIQGTLEEKYGKVTIDMKSGEISKIKEDATN